MQPYVTFRDISKSYDGKSVILSNLNLDVQRGEFLTLLGPSGSGKTTALMILAGFETPTTGEIFVEGRPYSALPAHRRDIGVVFQDYALFPHMSVGENIAFPLRVRAMSENEISRRVASALEMVRLPEISARKPDQLSGGQRQRVALARALVYEPKIILMDEPLGALDRQLREEMQMEIKSIHQRVGVTVIYVTHDQGEALTMSDRIAILRNGNLEQIADPQSLYDRPRNAFVATFIGDSNLLSGSVSARREGYVNIELPGVGGIIARSGDDGNAGQAYVAVRPEKITILVEPRTDGDNVLTGIVEKTVYFGDHRKLIVRLPGGQTIAIKTSTADAFATGQALTVSWARDDCTAFTDSGAEALPAAAPEGVNAPA